MLDIIQYEFNISIRLMNDFFESESAWPLIEGMARSWALVRSLLLAWLIGGNRWCRVCPGFLNISPNIRSSAESQIWANAGWVFGKKPPFIAFFSTPSSLLRPCASSRPHHAWDAYVSGYEGGSSHLPQQRSGQTMPPQCTKGIHSLCAPGHQTCLRLVEIPTDWCMCKCRVTYLRTIGIEPTPNIPQ